MKYRDSGEYEIIAKKVYLTPFNDEYLIDKFNCGIDDYNIFLTNDAKYYIDKNISSISLLIDKESNDVIGYIALLADAFLLDQKEKDLHNLNIPFNSVPALKIGKIAVDKNRNEHHYGSFLLETVLGYAEKLIQLGIACRFITVDADIEYNKNTLKFYKKNGFIINQHRNYSKKTKNISMRYDIFT